MKRLQNHLPTPCGSPWGGGRPVVESGCIDWNTAASTNWDIHANWPGKGTGIIASASCGPSICLSDVFLGDLHTQTHTNTVGLPQLSLVNRWVSSCNSVGRGSPFGDTYLTNMLVVETVPLAISEGFDTGIVVAACSTPRVDHHREELKSQRILQMGQRKQPIVNADHNHNSN